MNRLTGTISQISVKDHLSLVKISISGAIVTAIVIDTPATAPYLTVGDPINILFKESEVIIAIGQNRALSIENEFEGVVNNIERGSLLSRVILSTQAGEITAVVPSEAVERLSLKKGKTVYALIKTNEVMLSI